MREIWEEWSARRERYGRSGQLDERYYGRSGQLDEKDMGGVVS